MSKALQELAATLPQSLKVNKDESAPQSQTKPSALSGDQKWKALKAVEANLNKQFSTTTSLVRLGSRVGKPIPSIPTALPTFDNDVAECGGIPRGRIIEVYGPESSGKTTWTLHIVAQEQKNTGNICAFVDAEHALDPTYAKKLGVDVNNLLVAQPDSGEQALETVIALVLSDAVSLIIVDSVAALVPQAELDGEMGDSHMGLQARLMSQAMRKLRGICAVHNVTVIFINQIREKIGVMFGSPETTTGGRALKFYSSMRLDTRKVSGEDGKGKIMSGGVQIGHQMRIKAVKNKVGTPFHDTAVDLIYGVGFDIEADTIEYAIACGAIQQSGAWFSVFVPSPTEKKPDAVEEIKVQGKPKLKELIKDSPAAMAAVKAEIAKALAAQRKAEQEDAVA